MTQTSSECPNKDRCGSCTWSNIPYEQQLQQKLNQINAAFDEQKLKIRCEEIVPSPKINHYRNRMDFVIDFQGRVGLRERGKWWSVIDNHPCFLGDESINDLFAPVRSWAQNCGLSFYDRRSHEGFLRYAVIRASSGAETMLSLVTSYPDSACEAKVKEFADSINAQHVIWSLTNNKSDPSVGDELIVLKGAGYLTESILGKSFQISPNAFFQTNSYAAPQLAECVREFANTTPAESALDLYCGTGFFTLLLADRFKKIVGVEMVPQAISDAKANAQINNSKAEFVAATTESFTWEQYNPELIILDPPRGGLHKETLQRLMALRPRNIVYVSCNFKRFAQDFSVFQQHYTAEKMRAIDLFPHTPHVELVTLLTRSLAL